MISDENMHTIFYINIIIKFINKFLKLILKVFELQILNNIRFK